MDYEERIATLEAEVRQLKEALSIRDDDWVDWSGGDAPVGSNALVEIRCADGWRCRDRCSTFRWGHHTGSPGDIIAYRVLSESIQSA